MDFKVGDIITGEIMDFTHEGNGVMKIDNFAFFIPRAIIGDKVEVKIIELKKNFGIGSITKLIEPSFDRTNENIKSYSGEVPLINYRYNKQLEWKNHKVKMDLLKFAGVSQVEVEDTIGMENPYRYRNHIQIPIGNKNGKAVLGFFEKGSHDIVDMDGTILQPEIGDEILKTIRKWTDKYNIKPYDRASNKGILRHVGIRINKDSQVMVIIVTATDYLPKSKELVDMLSDNKNVISICHNINNLKSAPTYGRKYINLYGENRLVDFLGNFKFNISPNSFFQVNRSQAEVLYNTAMDFLKPSKDDLVFDIYCGIGTISLYIAKDAKKVYGVESVKAAIDDARENAELNNIGNVEFITGKAEEVFPELMAKGIKGNKVVVDPPRKGCEPQVLEAIVKLSPERVVYVSCNSTTMSRDCKYLIENGYQIKKIQPVDMFPHTAGIEVVVRLDKKLKNG